MRASARRVQPAVPLDQGADRGRHRDTQPVQEVGRAKNSGDKVTTEIEAILLDFRRGIVLRELRRLYPSGSSIYQALSRKQISFILDLS